MRLICILKNIYYLRKIEGGGWSKSFTFMWKFYLMPTFRFPSEGLPKGCWVTLKGQKFMLEDSSVVSRFHSSDKTYNVVKCIYIWSSLYRIIADLLNLDWNLALSDPCAPQRITYRLLVTRQQRLQICASASHGDICKRPHGYS